MTEGNRPDLPQGMAAVSLRQEALFVLESTDPLPASGVSPEELDYYLHLGQVRAFLRGARQKNAARTLASDRHRARCAVVGRAVKAALAEAEPPPLLRGVWPRDRYIAARDQALVLAAIIFPEAT